MNIYEFIVTDINNNEISLREYEDKVLLIVNTASQCGLTPQYQQLESIYKQYKDKGFEILAFPCNQFLNQSPGSSKEEATFCETNYGTTFKTFAKVDVNGKDADPLFKVLKIAFREDKTDASNDDFMNKIKDFIKDNEPSDIKWNFTKFLVNRKGNVVERFAPTYSFEEIKKSIENYL